MTIIEAMTDPNLFGRWFARPTWGAWRAFLAAAFGLPLTDEQAALYHACTGRQDSPTGPAGEVWVVAGRRSGKSRVAALLAVFGACFRDYAPYLAPGEVATVPVIAADRKQARTIMRYVTGFLDHVPMLAAMVTSRTRETIEFNNRTVIEVHTCSFRSTRGYTLCGAIGDEVAFWRSEDSASPDVEILNGLRPGMSTIPGALLLCISSPYARRGALYDTYAEHYGRDGSPVLVWQADTATMNPTVNREIIKAAYRTDEAAAAAEYGAQFRRDIENFLTKEAVAAAVVEDRRELPYCADCRYVAFVDPSGGSHDSYTMAIAHRDPESHVVALDAIRERRPPFSPEQVTEELAALLRSYRLHEVHGDRYAGEWPREQFRKHGVWYLASEKVKSDLYRELLAPLNSGRLELLDHPRLIAQLCQLERRTARGGRDSIDHGPGGHDDVANAAAGALVLAATGHEPGDLGITL